MVPAPADRPALDAGHVADLAGWDVEVVDEASSTNALVAERAQAGAPEGLVVVAEHQTAGRGRLDRTWVAPARSGLTFSVLLRPSAPASRWPWLPLLTGYAVCRALAAAGHDASVKWPNDVLLDGRKVAGVLVERVETPTGPAAVVGVGLNVAMSAGELPVPEATSLAVARPDDVPDRTDLLLALLDTMRGVFTTWEEGREGPRLAEAYAASCATLGREVRVLLPSGAELVGAATGVDDHGRLLVERAGATTAVSAGDVVHVRAP